MQYCPKCFKILILEEDCKTPISCDLSDSEPVDIEAPMYCDLCSAELVDIDEVILPTIKLLNEKGYGTIYSCAGHTYIKSNPYILFDKNTSENILKNLEYFKSILPGGCEIKIFKDFLNGKDCLYPDSIILYSNNFPENDLDIHEAILTANLKFLFFAKNISNFKKEGESV